MTLSLYTSKLVSCAAQSVLVLSKPVGISGLETRPLTRAIVGWFVLVLGSRRILIHPGDQLQLQQESDCIMIA